MDIKQRKIGEIHPYGKNAKKHPEKQVLQIAESIKAFGFNQPVVVDKKDIIIVGHGRYIAAHLLGLETIPVLTLDIDEDSAKAYRLADNKLNESEWDMELVINELKTLEIPLVDLTGFDRSLILNVEEKDDDVPPLPEKPKSKIGDLYELGGHRILCGDSCSQADFTKLMANAKADMVFTDPPYNVNYKGRGENTSNGILNDKMDGVKFRQFLVDAFKNMVDNIKRGGGLYIFHSSSTQATFEEAMKLTGLNIKNQLIWNKPTASMGWGDYRWKHEPFFYAHIQDSSPHFYGDRTKTTIIDFQKTEAQLVAWAKQQKQAETEGRTTIWTMKREPMQEYVHPTQKPVELITYALHNSSKVDDIVLDPFSGSGATLIACQKTNRKCYGLELDPRYVDVIVSRYCQYVGNNTIKRNGEKIVW